MEGIESRFVLVRHNEGSAELVPWTRIVKIMHGEQGLFAVLRRERDDNSVLKDEDGTTMVDVIDTRLTTLWNRLQQDRRMFGEKCNDYVKV